MGLSSKKSSSKGTTTNQNTSTATTTPDVPDWIANPTKTVAGNITDLLGQGPGAFAPQTSDLQQSAFENASDLATSPYLEQAGEAFGNIGNVGGQSYSAASVLDGGLDRYYNPFRDQVLNPALADYDEQSGLTRAAQSAQAAKNKAFQGSRYGIQEAATEGQLARGRASTEGGLLDRMYTQAMQAAEADAARRQEAASFSAASAMQAALANQGMDFSKAGGLANLGGLFGSENRANLGVQAGLGGVQTDQQNAIRQYPIQYQGQMEGLLGGLNPELYTGRTVSQSGQSSGTSSQENKSTDFLGGLGQVAQIAALFAPVPH